ncbi:Oligoribonuclease, mitochondrial [Parelaphostrongylus tenuis]|uniref:Oligoribonuclease, mitochondrial n=1 Tax=Parelaphostrongylus tenuis TaxID=148309 RepID=A0AAD5R623_PARTN|nr:Oligoribonuclease, mitochondrial [Parelaphostrongylus tenuis]
MSWIDPYLDERAQLLRHVKRKHDEELSDYGELDDMVRNGSGLGYMVAEKGRGEAGADVLLDGDSAFAASAVSDLRTLPEHARTLAKIIAEGPDIVINQPEEVLDNMEDWSRKTFAENGLLSKIRESKIDMKQAEDIDSFPFLFVLVAILDFLANETVKQACPLAGNSVDLDRSVSLTTLTRKKFQLAARWYPKEFKKAPLKRQTHRALDDIRESIEELRYYRSSIFHQ